MTVTLLEGLIGGLVATIVMTALMMALGDDSPPPTAVFWSKYVGDGPPEDYMMQGMVLHLVYGTGAGSVLAALGSEYLDVVAYETLDASITAGLVNGVAYGVILFLVAIPIFRVVLEMDPEPRQVGMMGFFHLVYGAVIGAFFGLQLL